MPAAKETPEEPKEIECDTQPGLNGASISERQLEVGADRRRFV